MSAAVAELLTAALKLDDAERGDLAERLWESLDPAPDEVADPEFEAELLRRRDEARRDPGVLIPWDVVRAMP